MDRAGDPCNSSFYPISRFDEFGTDGFSSSYDPSGEGGGSFSPAPYGPSSIFGDGEICDQPQPGGGDPTGTTSSTCTLRFNLGDKFAGSYPNDYGPPPEPENHTAGPFSYNGGSFFFFEVQVTPADGTKQSDWTANQALVTSGSIVTTAGQELLPTPSTPDDSPVSQVTDRTGNILIWLDSPGFGFSGPAPPGGYPTFKSGSMKFDITATSTGPHGAQCSGHIVFTLGLKDGKLDWTHTDPTYTQKAPTQ